MLLVLSPRTLLRGERRPSEMRKNAEVRSGYTASTALNTYTTSVFRAFFTLRTYRRGGSGRFLRTSLVKRGCHLLRIDWMDGGNRDCVRLGMGAIPRWLVFSALVLSVQMANEGWDGVDEHRRGWSALQRGGPRAPVTWHSVSFAAGLPQVRGRPVPTGTEFFCKNKFRLAEEMANTWTTSTLLEHSASRLPLYALHH